MFGHIAIAILCFIVYLLAQIPTRSGYHVEPYSILVPQVSIIFKYL